MPQPAPTHGDITGSHPLSTDSGCSITRTVAFVGSTDVTKPKRGWAWI